MTSQSVLDGNISVKHAAMVANDLKSSCLAHCLIIEVLTM